MNRKRGIGEGAIRLDAKDEDEYVSMAIRVASDKEYRQELSNLIFDYHHVLFGSREKGTFENEYVQEVSKFLFNVGKGVAEERLFYDNAT